MKSLRNVISGRTKLRYHFELVPKSVEGIKCQHDVSVVCESGSKISYTEPNAVAADGTASFSSVMRMTATIYKDNNTLLPKEYTFKIQAVQPPNNRLSSEPRRKTIARAKLNLAVYCSHSSTPAASEVQLQLKPSGVLNLTIKAIWLQHYPKEKQDGRGSETDSTAEVSSHFSSISGEDMQDEKTQSEAVDRRPSVNLDDLADYHHHHHASSGNLGTVTPALTASYQNPAMASSARIQPQQQQQSANIGRNSRMQLTSSASQPLDSVTNVSARHKRSSSTPAALPNIPPILEHDKEGLDTASSLDRTLSTETQEAINNMQHQQQHSFLGIVRDDSTAAAAAALAAAVAAEEAEEPSGLRALSFPSWMWPFGGSNGRKATTDELMRQIDASGGDAPKLQQMCRALLCERNDWRYKATQWERNANSLEQQVSQLQQAKAGLLQHLQSLEAQLLQLQDNALLDDLVAAKLQLAQAQEYVDTLEGELHRERDRNRRLAAQLTAVESKYAMLYEQQAAAAAADQQQQLQQASSAEQGEGLSMPSPTAVVSSAATGRRVSYTGGWGSMFMRAGSLVMGTAAAGNGISSASNSSSTAHLAQHQQAVARRASEPGLGAVLEAADAAQRSARQSVA